jgi:hypothetical protein
MATASGCIILCGNPRDPYSGRGSGKRLPCLNHVGVGDEVVIEHDTGPAALVWSVAPAPSPDNSSASLARKPAHEGRECVPPALAKYLDHSLYVREAL